MRIILAHKLLNLTGGAEVFFREVGRVLSENGHEVYYLSTMDIDDIDVLGSNELHLSMCGQEKSAMRNGAISSCVGLVLIVAGASTGSLTNLALSVAGAILFARLLSWMSVVRTLGFSADLVTAILSKFKTLES